MSLIYETRRRPSLFRWTREFNPDGSEKHEILDGARFHVLSYSTSGTRCSEPNCEVNKYGDLGKAIVHRVFNELWPKK